MRIFPRLSAPVVMIVAALLSAVALGGCATLKAGADAASESPRVQALVRATVQYAVLRTVGGHADRALEVARIAGAAVDYARSDDVTSAGQLEQAVRDRLDTEAMTVETRILADTLIGVIRHEIDRIIDGEVIDSETIVQVVAVLGWVEAAARQAAEAPPDDGQRTAADA